MKRSLFLVNLTLGLLVPGLVYAKADYQLVTKALNEYELVVAEHPAANERQQLASASSSVSNTYDSDANVSTTSAPASAPVAVSPVTPEIPAAAEEDESKTVFGDLLKKYEIEPTGTATLDYYSRYVWRGQYLDKDEVFQPGVTLSAKGFTIGYWSSWDMGNKMDTLNSDESDYFASYTYTAEAITITGGHTWYGFPGSGTSTREFFASVGVAMPLSPVLSYFHDYQDGKEFGMGNGDYYSLALSHTMELYKPKGITLTLGGTLGYIDHQWLNGRGYHFTPTAAVNFPITKTLTISPTVGYNFVGGDLEDEEVGNLKSTSFGGVHSVITF